MSEELYFFKFEKDRAKKNLISLIDHEQHLRYKDYLKQNSPIYHDKSVIFDVIKSKINEDVATLTVDELWSLFNWFYKNHEPNFTLIDYTQAYHSLISKMKDNGLDLFYEITSKTQVRVFHDMLNDYEWLSETQFDNRSPENVSRLREFIDYLICYTGKLNIFVNEHYYTDYDRVAYNSYINELIDTINRRSNHYNHKLVITMLESQYDDHMEIMRLAPQLSAFYRENNANKSSFSLPIELNAISERLNSLLTATDTLQRALDILECLKDYNGEVIWLHS
jgi:hypothetical protein